MWPSAGRIPALFWCCPEIDAGMQRPLGKGKKHNEIMAQRLEPKGRSGILLPASFNLGGIQMKMTSKLLLASAMAMAVSGSAMAADLYAPPPAAPVAVAPAVSDWDGPYVGASVGYGWASVNDSTVSDSTTADGWLLGGQVGYNFHLSDTIVAGVEGDLNWNNQQGSGFTGGDAGDSYRINWDGSIRGRLGLDFDGVLPYVEAGVAFANADLSGPVAAANNTYTGWTAGAGVEFKVSDPISVNVEYRYSDYGDQTYGGDSVHLNDNIVKLGLNYHF
jgi:opacity protein-like surface antigen